MPRLETEAIGTQHLETEAIGTQHLDLPHGGAIRALDEQEPPDHYRVGIRMPR